MKVKYQQCFSNECGLCSIKNLLYIFKIKFKDFKLNYDEKGTNILNMIKVLKNYFYNVDAVSFDINQLRKVKKFSPFIALLKKDNVGHYVVIYKKNQKYLFIIDSLAKKTFKVKYEDFSEIFSNKAIIVSEEKEIKVNLKNNKRLVIVPILSLLENLLLLSTTIFLQKIIDNSYSNALIYILIQIGVLLITTIKLKLFLKTFKYLDENLTTKTLKSIYNLKKTFLSNHSINEVFYRLNDSYDYKNMVMSFFFVVINDLILAILTISLMFVYSYIIASIILFLCIFVILFSFKIFNNTREIVEEKRKLEYDFLVEYRLCYNEKNTINNKNKNKILMILKNIQKKDYILQKVVLKKNLILLYFQTFIVCVLVMFYFTNLYNNLTIGSLIALINLSSLMLQPILNLCSELTNFSNFTLIKDRLNQLNENQK